MKELMYKPNPENLAEVFIPNGTAKRQVVCAANRYVVNGEKVVILGVRHHCPLMNKMLDLVGIDWHTREQGFVDQWGNYMNREEALFVLKTNGRWIRDEDYSDELYSENLY
jgi:hypothetical protein